ncbi:hypothetical protein [Sulfitobacter sp. SK011]|uniref:hypothetical protein n=1 Tax=Sulfitobacter sp. SK011 TaxID=1389004 RepID=UPI000E0A7B32|nr:hypothetical protein [Sulfitobacter sp. SK011]AXI42877.1 hypothetical protein C1J02_13720 [Sulfitobacter sp. SK011]
MTAPFVFDQQARSRKTLLIVVSIWVALVAAWIWLDAALWIVAFLAAFTLPAVSDLIRNPLSGLTLNNQTLSWFSGRRNGTLELSEIDHIRLDTRLDFSVRVTAVLTTGRKIRLPFESTPPHQAFQNALEARGVKTQRHHFQLLQ